MSECCKRLRDNGDTVETVLPLQSTSPGDGAIRQRTAADFEKMFHDRAERANRLASAGLLCAAQTEIVTGRQSLSRLLPCSGVSSCCAGFITGGCFCWRRVLWASSMRQSSNNRAALRSTWARSWMVGRRGGPGRALAPTCCEAPPARRASDAVPGVYPAGRSAVWQPLTL